MLDEIHVTVVSKQTDGENNVAITLSVAEDYMPTLEPTTVRFIQTQDATEMGIAVLPYGGVIFGANFTLPDSSYFITAEIKGVTYTDDRNPLTPSSEIGDAFTLARVDDSDSGSGGGGIRITPPG